MSINITTTYGFVYQEMGSTLGAKARIQINLAVSQVVDIKQVATFPDIVFPIMWFEDVSISNHVRLILYVRYALRDI